MEMKRIKAPDIRTALRMAREQLGPDAMILSNRRVADGIEIVASAEVAAAMNSAPEINATAEDVAASAKPTGDQLEDILASRSSQGRLSAPMAPDLEFPTADALAALAGKPRSDVSREQFDALNDQLREMRQLLESRLEAGKGGASAARDGISEQVWQRLGAAGFPEELNQRMLARIHPRDGFDAAWQRVLDGLADELPETGDLVSKGGIYAVVGPTGAGKSTTLCKLAVRWALENGPDALSIVSLDTQRVGGADMPRSIARLLGCDFYAAEEGEQLASVLTMVRGKRLVLIDTAGVTGGSGAAQSRIESLGMERKRVSSLLVLPATANARFLALAAEKYQAAVPVACVITKVDESPCLGEALGVACREQLPIAYSTHGPDIPDDISLADAAGLVASAVSVFDEDAGGCSPQYEDSEAFFGRSPDGLGQAGLNGARIA